MITYSKFIEKDKYGLHYTSDGTRVVALEPIYTSIHIVDFDEVLRSSSRIPLVGIQEFTNFAIVEADEKQGMISWGKIVIEFQYERIIKLSWRHYLCKKGITYFLYDHCSYDKDKFPLEIELLAKVTLEGELTMSRFMEVLSTKYPEAYAQLQSCLSKDLTKKVYISQYRCWEGRPGSHGFFVRAATQKVLISENFKIIPQEIEYEVPLLD